MDVHVPKPAPAICPTCGAEVPARALACPECGADHATGWNEEATAYDGIDLPDREFNYAAYVAREFGGRAPAAGASWKIWTAIVMIIALGIALLWWLTSYG